MLVFCMLDENDAIHVYLTYRLKRKTLYSFIYF